MEQVTKILEQSRALGFLGPGPIRDHIDHALAYVPWVQGRSRILDLGSGGGVPGLVLAMVLPETSFVLVDASRKRCDFLENAVHDLGVENRVEVANGRAEDLARLPRLRHAFDAVVARSFGPPAVVAECSVGFLVTGGRLVVSEPPTDSDERWNSSRLELLGLVSISGSRDSGVGLRILQTERLCNERYPRRNGIPAKRPLF